MGRYLRAMTMRLDAVTTDPRKDRERMAQVQRVEQAYGKVVDRFAGGAHDAELERIGWGIEELRVHLFAQRLGTAQSVSATRLLDAIAAIERAG
jgi:ATP-dependent helicase HrpA